MPTVNGILETALYVEDLERAVRFYRTVFGFEVLGCDDAAPIRLAQIRETSRVRPPEVYIGILGNR